MAYSKTTWSDNTTPAINQSNLNKIEAGILALHALEANTASAVTSNGNRITAADNSLNASKSNSESAVTISGKATDNAEAANPISQEANTTSSTANSYSNMATIIVKMENMFQFPDELRTICETRLCKEVDITGVSDDYLKYADSCLFLERPVTITEDVTIIEEDEPIDYWTGDEPVDGTGN